MKRFCSSRSATLALVTLVALVGCGGSGGAGADAGDEILGSDAGPTATPDAATAGPDASEPPDAEIAYDAGPTCASQQECGDVLAQSVTGTCVDDHCRAPGELVNVDFESYYDQTYTQPGARPLVQLTRLLLGTRLDGAPLTCADLLARSGGTEATRARIDTDPLLNQAFRNLTVLSWAGSTQGGLVLFRLFYDAPRGAGFLLFAEAWYGPREGDYGSGNRAATSCSEHIDLSADPAPKLVIHFKP